jgi:hypothetical protein
MNKVAVSKSTNPIVRAVETYMLARGIKASLRPAAAPEKETKKIILITFDVELRQQLGDLVLEALMNGNKEFAETVKKAIKEMDRVFIRDREKAIADKVFEYYFTLPKPRPTGKELRKVVEEHCNNGNQFKDYRWRRLKEILLLPRNPVGAPKKARNA